MCEEIARLCHEANRELCLMQDDYSQQVWSDAPTWQRESAIAGVNGVLANPRMTAEQNHEGWLAMKRAEGWVYGDEKDADAKEHPCMVPFEKLPPDQQLKDKLFLAIAKTCLEHEGAWRDEPEAPPTLVELSDAVKSVCGMIEQVHNVRHWGTDDDDFVVARASLWHAMDHLANADGVPEVPTDGDEAA